ncbi:MAG: hypothetical protein ACM3SY_06055 [Candidatus Omnitrophota bacterium]
MPTSLLLSVNIARDKEIERIKSRLLSNGQSSAIIGQNGSGKTSLMQYFADEKRRYSLFGNEGQRLLISYIDASILGDSAIQSEFWEKAFFPIFEASSSKHFGESINKAYRTCKDEGFCLRKVDPLICQMQKEKWRLVFLIDEFDSFRDKPQRDIIELLGGLRSLASRCYGTLSLIISCRQPLIRLFQRELISNMRGSPFFNIFEEIYLRPIANENVGQFMAGGLKFFSPEDNDFIIELAGGHPSLLKTATSSLSDLYRDRRDPQGRREEVERIAIKRVQQLMADTWENWPSEFRSIFQIIARSDRLRSKKYGLNGINLNEAMKYLSNRKDELWELEKLGFIVEDPQCPIGWKIRSLGFWLWFMEELNQCKYEDE